VRERSPILDVRPEDEFALGHLPGAVNMPLRELEMRLAEFNPRQEIVAYCRGPYCVLSYEAVAVLRAAGVQSSTIGRWSPGVARRWSARRYRSCVDYSEG
jgi:rhodanese-related sulfurtransferase